jgi:hypothetical protein
VLAGSTVGGAGRSTCARLLNWSLLRVVHLGFTCMTPARNELIALAGTACHADPAATRSGSTPGRRSAMHDPAMRRFEW